MKITVLLIGFCFIIINFYLFLLPVSTRAADTVIDAASYETTLKKEMIKDRLSVVGQVSSDKVKEILNMDLLAPQFRQVPTGYVLVTGRAGTTEGDVTRDQYTIDAYPIPGKDIKIPSLVDLSKKSFMVIPVFISNGSGKVEKLTDNQLVDIQKAKPGTEISKVSIAVFENKDNDGEVDAAEKILPLAGVKVKLTKLNQENTIVLLAGWNLVTLTALPVQAMTASTLLAEIAKQGGYATTVSSLENGFWKSYVVRGDKTYSGEDFGIEPGKAYFVKSEKKSTFTFAGQNFVTPIKLNLASGWNAVGFPKTSKAYKAADLPGDAAARWESGLWDTFVKQAQEEFGENFVIAKNRGYLVRLEQGKEFSP